MRWLCLDFLKVIASLLWGVLKGTLFSSVGLLAAGTGGTIIMLLIGMLVMVFLAVVKGVDFVAAIDHRSIARCIAIYSTIVGGILGFLYGLISGFRNTAEKLELW